MTYSFLVLSLLLLIPGFLVWLLRPDLRSVIYLMALASIPFAFTERLFYPDYWEPLFLFDLVNIIGFGIEDILFVTGLGAFTSTAWAFFTGQMYTGLSSLPRVRPLQSALLLLLLCFVMVAILALIGVPMIYGAPIIMTILGVAICAFRPDLLVPSLGGAAITTLVYTTLCIVLAVLIPQVFELDWKTDQFLNLFVLGVPLEEIIYAAAAGFIATAFYPFVAHKRFAPKEDLGEAGKHEG